MMRGGGKITCYGFTFSVLMVSTILCGESVAAFKRVAVRRIRLTQKQETRIVRFLFPLPQDCRIGDFAFSFAPTDCSIKVDPKLTDQEKLFVADFQGRWKKHFGAELPIDGKRNGGLTIVVGTLTGTGKPKKYAPLREAGKKNLIDLKHLASRPNAEQAYAITCTETSGGITAYLAANNSSGLYYALGTFEQLLRGIEKKPYITVPLARIVDWPDIKKRGAWATRLCRTIEDIGLEFHYASMKLNQFGGPMLWFQVSKDKKIWIDYDKYRPGIARGKRNNLQMVPFVPHFDGDAIMRMRRLHFPEIVSEAKGRAWCYANPKSQDVMDRMFEAIVRDTGTDYVEIWLSEGTESYCLCEVCQGDKRRQLINEVKHVMHAYEKARAIRPSLKIRLLFTQGTYKHNLVLLDFIPKDIRLLIYAGSGPANTYKLWIGEYLLLPSVTEMRRQGYRVGVMPLLAFAGHHPFNTPLMIKLRMSEFRDRDMESVIAFAWNFDLDPPNVNSQAMAEFSWNASGRTPEEFAISWALRRGMTDPELAAKVICMLEYPARALSAGRRARTMVRPVKRMGSILLGKKPKWGSYFSMPKGFEYSTHEEFARVLKVCEEGIVLSEKLGDEEFVTGARLLKQWIAIFERFTFFQENKDDPSVERKAVDDIIRLSDELPGVRAKWMVARQPWVPKNWLDSNGEQPALTGIMEEFERLKNTGKEDR